MAHTARHGQEERLTVIALAWLIVAGVCVVLANVLAVMLPGVS